MEKTRSFREMEKSTIDFTVIVPVYNTEEYLDRCIESILNQTFTNYELLLVNDGSKDNSLQILRKFEKIDKRITVFTQENQGVSVARNLGIENAKGEYICFIDSDDWVENDYLENLYKNKTSDDTLVILDFIRWGKRKNPTAEVVLDIKEDIDQLILNHKILENGGPCCKLYSADIIKKNDLKFTPKVTRGQDLIFYLSYLKHIKRIKFVDSAGYHYCYSDFSSTARKHGFDSLFKVHLSIKNFIQNFPIHQKPAKYEAYKIDWNLIEQSIDEGVVGAKSTKKEKVQQLNEVRKSLTKDHFTYTKAYRKVQYVLLKYRAYGLFLKMKQLINKE